MTVLLSETFSRTRRRSVFVLLLALILTLVHAPLTSVQAADGDLDPTFGNGGKVTTDVGARDILRGLAVQSDGRVVAAGVFQMSQTSTDSEFMLCRYKMDGSLDPTFGTNGVVITGFGANFLGNSLAGAKAVVVQPDGRIVAGGSAMIGFQFHFALARYNADGSLDATFGNGGKVLTSLFGIDDEINCLAIQTDGRILAAGTVHTGGNGYDFGVARYNPDGTLDGMFGLGGKVATDFDSLAGQFSHDEARAIVLQNDGKIVLVGEESGNATTFSDFALARYNTNGTLDGTFGTGGRVTTDFFGGQDFALAVAIQPDGKLIVGGAEDQNAVFTQDFALARYNTNGSLDLTFGTGGKVATDFTTDFSKVLRTTDSITGLVIQPDGKIVAGGAASGFIGTGGFALARYNTNGALDSSFGASGKVLTSVTVLGEMATCLAGQSDGKLVLAGIGFATSDDADFALARYEGTTFDICIQDDSNGSVLQLNSTTGQYVFTNCTGIVVGGVGSLSKKGGLITLQHNSLDRRLLAKLDLSTGTGSVALQLLTQGTKLFISDRNIRNNTCACR